MDCALWLNRRKIFTAAEISGNLDIASLRGYLLAGTLIDWLNEHGGKRYARKLSALSPDDEQLGEKIAEIFGTRPTPFKELNGGDTVKHAAPALPEGSFSSMLSSYPIGSAGSYNYAALSSFGSFESLLSAVSTGSYSLSSFSGGSFGSEWERLFALIYGYGSFSFGSLSFGSFLQWEWLFQLLYGYGSFSAGSFSRLSFGSFHEHEWEWLFRLLYGYGSFSAGSFSFGSLSFASFWQWEQLLRLLFGYGSFPANSFTLGSFSLENLLQMLFSHGGSFGYGSFGSFKSMPPSAFPSDGIFIDEYDLIMLQTLANCPLDRFGYGIHNI